MTVSPEKVKELREATGSSVMDCKKALEESKGDQEKALKLLAVRSKAVTLKKQSREANVGIVEAYIHANGRVGVLLELMCETDFVARNAKFKELAHDLALHIAALKPAFVSPESVPEALTKERESFFVEETAKEGKPQAVQTKIVAGKLGKFLSENSLLTQPFVKDSSKTVQDVINEYTATLGEKIVIGQFTRYEI